MNKIKKGGQTKHYETKSPEVSLSSFCTGHLCLGIGAALECGLYSQYGAVSAFDDP